MDDSDDSGDDTVGVDGSVASDPYWAGVQTDPDALSYNNQQTAALGAGQQTSNQGVSASNQGSSGLSSLNSALLGLTQTGLTAYALSVLNPANTQTAAGSILGLNPGSVSTASGTSTGLSGTMLLLIGGAILLLMLHK